MSIDQQNDPQISHILGIDFGEAKVGLALADFETKIAFAYNTLENDKNFLENLLKIIQKENISKIIIGVPSYINKKEVVYEGEKLGEMIKKSLPKMEIEYQNEMFTTKMAQANLIAKKVKGVKRFDDQEAARIILQSWLDKK
ncbi:MAG TPA: Holliday junction resolvase RuvX [Candidatus Moranbacteria bacterium]|nr:Holliday junction resolvase RuvX [Candidatus Moranbacteria bacterium]